MVCVLSVAVRRVLDGMVSVGDTIDVYGIEL